MFHIEGFGLTGCLVAVRLEDMGIPFTWYDPEREGIVLPTAWKASTGCCYPSDDALDRYNYELFPSAVLNHPWLGRFVTSAHYGYGAVNPPHYTNKSKAQIVRKDAGVSFLNEPSYHINVQEFVIQTRERFKDKYVKSNEQEYQVMRSHGFSPKATNVRYFWGWSVRGRIENNTRNQGAVCLNLQHKRYGIWYAYPVPGTPDTYYLGTAFICQKAPKSLDMKDKFAKFKAHFDATCNPSFAITSVDMDSVVEGWRPQCTDKNASLLSVENDVLIVKPQYASGFRHHLSLWKEIQDYVAIVGGS